MLAKHVDLAALFEVFGRHLIVANVAKAVVVAASGSMVYLLGRDLKMARTGVAVALLFVATLWRTGFGVSLCGAPARAQLPVGTIAFVSTISITVRCGARGRCMTPSRRH